MEKHSLKVNYLIKQLTGSLLFFSTIFICAGRINYMQGLIYVSIGLLMIILSFTMLQVDDELLAERSKPGEGTKAWDKRILGLSFLTTLSMFAVAGLDSGRFHWSPEFHWSLLLAGAILTALGQLLFLVAQKQNKFFSSTVRIQTERNHAVCESGLYSVVRHPAYLGSIIQSIGFPFLFGSLWSIIPVCFSIILLIVRTSMEDKTLMNELSGYSGYSYKTRYRIIPYIW